MSGMEVSDIRNPGDLIFSLDNEIMAVPVKAGENIQPGNGVIIDDDNYAVKGNAADFDTSKGYGVCIHEGANNTGGANGALLIQIATGNAYVAMKAGGVVQPFKKLKLNSDSEVVESTITAVPNTVTLSTAQTALLALSNYIQKTLGTSYGNPGEMVKPGDVADNGTVVVRLGLD